MGLYNFEARFVPAILSGEKRHTIRAPRRHADAPGDTLHLYTGLRRKGARLLMRAPCTYVAEVAIAAGGAIAIDGHVLDGCEAEILARSDGFAGLAEMLAYWEGRLPFRGLMIHWCPEGRG